MVIWRQHFILETQQFKVWKKFINPHLLEFFLSSSFLTIQVYKQVPKQTVYEIAVQLYVEPFKYGMAYENSIPYRNMTDQMLHLVRFCTLV